MGRLSCTNDDVYSLVADLTKRSMDRNGGAVNESTDAVDSQAEATSGGRVLHPGSDTDDMASRLGWFAGVACPVSMSMFSSLLFLRVGYIVGNAGWLGALLLLILAYTILGLTVSSISAIATNGRIRSGGVYFMISRTMGLEIGASLGLIVFVANVIASALYATGFAEGFVSGLGGSGAIFGTDVDGYWLKTGISSGINLVNMVICVVGAKMFGRFTTFMLALTVICISFTSITFVMPTSTMAIFYTTTPMCVKDCNYFWTNGTFVGLLSSQSNLTLAANNLLFDVYQDCEDVTHPVSVATIFAVLFSGVTGILAGANLSGELKNPSTDIPYGTHVALGFTFFVYASLFFLTGLTCDRILLYNDCHYMADLMKPTSTYIVYFGILVCCWCASCSCLIGGARIVHAVSVDVGHCLRHLAKSSRATVVVTYILVQAVLMIGSLNEIAQMCCIFFLLAYFAVNFACFCLDWAAAPNFRPTFTLFHWSTSLAGMAITLVLMFFISLTYASVSWLMAILLFLLFTFGLDTKVEVVSNGSLTQRQSRQQHNWGRISQAIIFHQVRKFLLYLDPRLEHVKYWRPHLLLLVSSSTSARTIMRFANDLKKGGLLLVGHVYDNSDDTSEIGEDPTVEGYRLWHDLIRTMNIKAFPLLTVSASAEGRIDAVNHLIRLSGVGSVRPNTVMLAFPEVTIDNSVADCVATIRSCIRARKSVCVYRNFELGNSPASVDDILDRLSACGNGRQIGRRLWHRKNNSEVDIPYQPLTSQQSRSNSRHIQIDVWLVDWLHHLNSTSESSDSSTSYPAACVDDVTAMYMLQLACVLSMSRRWSGSTIRVLTNDPSRLVILQELVRVVRVKAQISCVANFQTETGDAIRTLSEVAAILKEETRLTTIGFMYLNPASIGASLGSQTVNSSAANRLFGQMDLLTKELGPVVFVHGTECVVSD